MPLHSADTNTGYPAGEKWQWHTQGGWFLVYLLLNPGPNAVVVCCSCSKRPSIQNSTSTNSKGWMIFLLGDKSILMFPNKQNSGILLWRKHCIQWAMVAFQQIVFSLRDAGSTLTTHIQCALSDLLWKSPFFGCSCSLQSRWGADSFMLPCALPLLSIGCTSRDGVLQHSIIKAVR